MGRRRKISHPCLSPVQNRQTTEAQDLVNKFTQTWPDVKVRTPAFAAAPCLTLMRSHAPTAQLTAQEAAGPPMHALMPAAGTGWMLGVTRVQHMLPSHYPSELGS